MQGNEQSLRLPPALWIGLKATIPSVHVTGMAQSLQWVVGPPTFPKDFYNSMRFLSSRGLQCSTRSPSGNQTWFAGKSLIYT